MSIDQDDEQAYANVGKLKNNFTVLFVVWDWMCEWILGKLFSAFDSKFPPSLLKNLVQKYRFRAKFFIFESIVLSIFVRGLC